MRMACKHTARYNAASGQHSFQMAQHPTQHNPKGDYYEVYRLVHDTPDTYAVVAQVHQAPTPNFPHDQLARLRLTPQEARHFAQLLVEQAELVEAATAAAQAVRV